MAEKHLKKCSTSLAIREMQIKTALRFHLTSVRMAKTNKTSDSSCLHGYGVRGTFIHCWWEYKLTDTMEISAVVSQEDGNQFISRYTYTTLGYIPKGSFILPQRHLLNYIHCCSIHNSQKLKTT